MSFYVLYQLPLQSYTYVEEYANYMQIYQLYGIFVSYMVFACDDVPHCCKGTHAKTIEVYLNANTCGS